MVLLLIFQCLCLHSSEGELSSFSVTSRGIEASYSDRNIYEKSMLAKWKKLKKPPKLQQKDKLKSSNNGE